MAGAQLGHPLSAHVGDADCTQAWADKADSKPTGFLALPQGTPNYGVFGGIRHGDIAGHGQQFEQQPLLW
jgi:hypothetical protein